MELQLCCVNGDSSHVEVVKEFFGHVICFPDLLLHKNVVFTLTQVMPNIYRDLYPEVNTEALLFVLVPDVEVFGVQPGTNNDDVRYGVATEKGEPITPAIAISIGLRTLYICLKPIGQQVVEEGNLGI